MKPTVGQWWNPWSTGIPWLTLAHHPLLYNPKENETTIYNVDDFFYSLTPCTNKVFESKRPTEKVCCHESNAWMCECGEQFWDVWMWRVMLGCVDMGSNAGMCGCGEQCWDVWMWRVMLGCVDVESNAGMCGCGE